MSAPKNPICIPGKRIRAAFDKVGLDQTLPEDWPMLVYSLLGEIHDLRRRRGRGAPRKEDGAGLLQLVFDVAEEEAKLQQALGMKPSRDAVFRKLVGGKYRGRNWKTVKKNYHDASKPKHNKALAWMLNMHIKSGQDWPLVLEVGDSGSIEVSKDEAGKVHFKPRFKPRLVAK